MDENPKKKRRRVKSINDDLDNIFSEQWSVKSFKTKKDLEDYIKLQGFKFRSSEEKTDRQRCRFCLALNPNSSQHMIQVYLNCKECLKKNKNCLKTNICEIQKKYELLNKHKDLCPKEWNVFDNDIQDDVIETKTDDFAFCDQLSDIFLKMNISNKIENEYNNGGSFYVWVVKDVLPNQRYLFKEVFLIKIKNVWIEFRNGRQKHKFKCELTNSEGIILHRDDDVIFELNSKQLFNCDENSVEYEGEWIFDPKKQNPCIECSSEINKMIFDCDQHRNDLIGLNQVKDFKVWKANLKLDFKYFKRKDLHTWEEYCNNELTNSFKFKGFNKNSDLIIQRICKDNPDYLRFTERELFIGSVKDYIYYPLYVGNWQKESEFTQTPLTETVKLSNANTLSITNIKDYLDLLKMFLNRNNIQIDGLEDPIFLRYAESDKINKFEEFARIIQTGTNQYAFCTGNLGIGLPGKNLYIFDSSQREDIDNNLLDQIKKFKDNIDPFFVKIKIKNDRKDLSGYYSLALLTAYAINYTHSTYIHSLYDLESTTFDELKLVDHFIDCLNKKEISLFPTKNDSVEPFFNYNFSPLSNLDDIIF